MSTPTGGTAVEDVVVVHDVLELPASRRRRIAIGAVLVVLGLFLALLLAKGAKGGVDTGFVLSPSGAAIDIPVVNLPARILCIVLGLVVVALGVWQIARGFSKMALRWVGSVAAVAFVVALLAWASTGRPDQPVSVIALLVQTVFLATPLILGAMAGVLCERSGVINVAIEGQMLAGAWAGALFGTIAHNLGVGVIAAVLAGGLLGLLLAVFSIRYLVNQVVLGVVLNLLALGLTGYIFDVLMQRDQDGLNNPGFFNPVKIPLLGDIPIVGPLLFDANVIVYLMYAIVIVIDIALFRTRWGLRTRAVGEHPKAADTVGINVLRVRYRNVVHGRVRGRPGRCGADHRRRPASSRRTSPPARASSPWRR